MDPVNLDTSYGGITASTFQGVATLITSAGPLEMEGARWHLLSKVFSSPGDRRTDLNRERLLQETMDKDTNCRSFAWKVLEASSGSHDLRSIRKIHSLYSSFFMVTLVV